MENFIDSQTGPHVPFRHLEQYQAYGLDRFLKADWPTCREEPWRRTDITAVDFNSFVPHHNTFQAQTRLKGQLHRISPREDARSALTRWGTNSSRESR